MKNRLLISAIFSVISMQQLAISFLSVLVFGIILSPVMNMPLVFAQQNASTAQQSKPKKKIPPPPAPPSRGVPGNRTVSASMSGNSCDLKIIALAPQFNQRSLGQISEKSVWGQTTAQHPTFWFFVPATSSSTQLDFSLQNQEEDIYRVQVPTPQQPGVIGVKIPSSQQALLTNRNYHWTFKAKVPCGSSTPNRVYVDGWVTRVNSPTAISNNSYAEKGIWYDAVTNLALQRLQKPHDLGVKQDWIDLLESVNLEEIAKQPLVKLSY
jgi:Domain of Unknown Function (DUF928)